MISANPSYFQDTWTINWKLGPCQVGDSSPNLLLKESLCFVKETLLRKMQCNFWENNNSPWGRKYSTLGRFWIIGFPRCKAKMWHSRGEKEKPGWFRHCRFWGKLGVASGRLDSSRARWFAGSGPSTVTGNKEMGPILFQEGQTPFSSEERWPHQAGVESGYFSAAASWAALISAQRKVQ